VHYYHFVVGWKLAVVVAAVANANLIDQNFEGFVARGSRVVCR
jgi:hypothetical protein